MSRKLANVIEEMIKHVPSNHSLIAELNSIHSSVLYASPEMMRHWWDTVAETLNAAVPFPKEDWQVKVASIFSTVPEEEIRKRLEG